MLNPFLILVGKFITWFSKITNRGNGSTWPGHIALETNKNFIRELIKKNNVILGSEAHARINTHEDPGQARMTVKHEGLKIILVAGTNGKTTTAKLIRFLLEKNGLKVFQNDSGANLLNGIASTLIKNANLNGKLNFDAAIFEVDENILPLVLKQIQHPTAIVLLNLFRDQLDRYGEVNTIAKKWQISLSSWPRPGSATTSQSLNDKTPILITNGDDSMLTYIAEKSGLTTYLFGLDEKLMAKKEIPHDVDFLYCPNCNTKLEFAKMSYSHMGLFTCSKCDFKHSDKVDTYNNVSSPLFGTYNIYNTNAAILVAEKVFGIPIENVKNVLPEFKAAFGRQEELEYQGKRIIIQLSKNPAGFNQSIEGVLSYAAENHNFSVLLVLNDRIPDGRDVSWIWDVDFERLAEANHIIISGDRAYDMALRIQYTNISTSKYKVQENLEKAVHEANKQTEKDEILFILPTYSAMLDVRKILSGKKIL